jgi:D-aminoacyl-tRNA deacylase
MNIAIISSTLDPASVNIKKNLLNEFEFIKLENKFENNDVYGYLINNKDIKLYTIDSKLIFADDLDKKIDANVFVFISKHVASDGKPSLTIHPIGNFGKAEFGGKEKTLHFTNPSLLKNIFLEMYKNNNEKFETTVEATHHGPFLDKQALFVEIGSVEEYWQDKEAGKIIANSIINGLMNEKEYESVFVVGGSHYNHIANKVMLKSDFSVGHICAKYNLKILDKDLIKQSLEKSNTKLVLLDWKGLGKEKQKIIDLLEKNNIEFKRSDKFF